MGSCLSTKKHSSPSSSNNVLLSSVIESAKGDSPELKTKTNSATEEAENKKVKKKQVTEEESLVKKEIFIIKHRKSHDREKRPSVSEQDENKVSPSAINENSSNTMVRTSSCTKEEVDAILIQCGKLSRSNSSSTPAAKARRYAGSKRSFDLDNDQDDVVKTAAAEDDELGDDKRQHRQRHRQPGRKAHSSPSQGRRRTPSRERDNAEQQRSGSSGRRVSRSPGRRSETNLSTNSGSATTTRPGKMVSVPATVNNGVESQTGNGVKRISVKRKVGEAAGSRAAASPRSQSPARTQSPARINARAGSIENNQLPFDCSNSRKAEQSPYRRNPLSEIDPNSLNYVQTTGNNKGSNGTTGVQTIKTRQVEIHDVVQEVVNQARVQKLNKVMIVEEEKSMPQTLTRSRSGRRSRDFDSNPETLTNPNPSYTALLLEDIQNFHQKTANPNGISNSNIQSFMAPACLTKACSILEAVADLNSTTSSNISTKAKAPFVESEVAVGDDLTEPSLHKYVTVSRGTLNGEDMDGQESSGSNSFAGQYWGIYSTSSWEPNSADSTDRWTSRSNSRDDDDDDDDERRPLEEARKGFSGQRTGIGRGVYSGKYIPVVAAAST